MSWRLSLLFFLSLRFFFSMEPATTAISFFFFNDPAPTEFYTLPLPDALPIFAVVSAEPIRPPDLLGDVLAQRLDRLRVRLLVAREEALAHTHRSERP